MFPYDGGVPGIDLRGKGVRRPTAIIDANDNYASQDLRLAA